MNCNVVFDFHSPHNNEYWYKCTTCGRKDWCAYYDKFETNEPLRDCKKEIEKLTQTNKRVGSGMTDDLVAMARLAQRDERMSTGALYGDLADRIEELEAKLVKALDIALEECPYFYGSGSYNDWWYDRKVLIEKLREGSDELG